MAQGFKFTEQPKSSPQRSCIGRGPEVVTGSAGGRQKNKDKTGQGT